MEILLIKITRKNNIKGIIYKLTEAKAEAFADETTLFMTRTKNNLIHATKYIQQFHTISGLACNFDKTHVIPIGKMDDPEDILCPELGMKWSSTFTILGFEIDSKLKHLGKNYTKVFEKIKGIFKSCTPYKLSLKGRLTIAKTLLVSQLT